MPIQMYWKSDHQKRKIFRWKILIFLHIFVQNRGGSNEYPQSMFLSRNKKNNVYPCKPQFYYIKVGFKGVRIIKVCFRDDNRHSALNTRYMKSGKHGWGRGKLYSHYCNQNRIILSLFYHIAKVFLQTCSDSVVWSGSTLFATHPAI